MNELQITIQTILTFFGGVTLIMGGISALAKLFDPFKKLKVKVNEHECKRNDDFNRMGKMDEAIERIENSNEIICESLFALLNHEITGNSVDKLIKQRDNLQKYLIEK